MIGHAIVAAIRGGLKESRELSDKASEFLTERTIERSRVWTLMFAHMAVPLIASMLGLIFVALHSDDSRRFLAMGESYLWVAMFGGLLGGYLSLVQKAGRGEWDAAAGRGAHATEVFTKLAAAVLLGAIAFAITQSTRVANPVAATPDPYSIFLFSFGAGFFERLIPKIVSTYSQSVIHTNHHE